MIASILGFLGAHGLDIFFDVIERVRYGRKPYSQVSEVNVVPPPSHDQSGTEQVDLAVIKAETERSDRRPKVILGLQLAFGLVCLTYFTALLLASIRPEGKVWLVVTALPEPWSLLALLGLGSLAAGPELLHALQKRLQ